MAEQEGAFVRLHAAPDPVLGRGEDAGVAGPGVGLESGVVRPDDVGPQLLDSALEETPALLLGDGGEPVKAFDGRQAAGSAEEVEVEPGVRIEAGEEAEPAAEDLVHLLGSPAVDDGLRELRDGEQLAAAGQAEGMVPEPAPPGELLGQAAGRFVVKAFGLEVHSMRWRCHLAGLPAS